MPVRAVLFDLVGSILDERSDYDALDAAMKQVVERWRIDTRAKELSGEFSLALMEILRGEPGVEERAEFVPFERAAKDIFAAILEFHGYKAEPKDVEWFWATYISLQRQAWRVYPDARKCLEDLKGRGYLVGVATDADRRVALELFPALKLEGRVDAIACAEEAGFVKPHPAVFRLALERLGAAPEETVMVGDSYERDVEGARACGIDRAILIDRHRARVVDVPTLQSLKRVPRVVDEYRDGVRGVVEAPVEE